MSAHGQGIRDNALIIVVVSFLLWGAVVLGVAFMVAP